MRSHRLWQKEAVDAGSVIFLSLPALSFPMAKAFKRLAKFETVNAATAPGR